MLSKPNFGTQPGPGTRVRILSCGCYPDLKADHVNAIGTVVGADTGKDFYGRTWISAVVVRIDSSERMFCHPHLQAVEDVT